MGTRLRPASCGSLCEVVPGLVLQVPGGHLPPLGYGVLRVLRQGQRDDRPDPVDLRDDRERSMTTETGRVKRLTIHQLVSVLSIHTGIHNSDVTRYSLLGRDRPA